MSQQQWANYYAQSMGRKASPNLLRALAAFPEKPQDALAIDLGCGVGHDTLELLASGWQVFAIDCNPLVSGFLEAERFDPFRERLTVLCEPFQSAVLPPAHLINAHLALPFCPPAEFPARWSKIAKAVRPGGRFAGNFFGPEDGWADREDMTFLAASHVRELFAGWDVGLFNEVRRE